MLTSATTFRSKCNPCPSQQKLHGYRPSLQDYRSRLGKHSTLHLCLSNTEVAAIAYIPNPLHSRNKWQWFSTCLFVIRLRMQKPRLQLFILSFGQMLKLHHEMVIAALWTYQSVTVNHGQASYKYYCARQDNSIFNITVKLQGSVR